MDCNTARLLMEFARPQGAELVNGELSLLDAHLASCRECERMARVHRAFDQSISRAMGQVPVPEGLKDRINERLVARLRLRRRRHLLRMLPVAAGVLLLFGLAYAVFYRPPTVIDPDAVLAEVLEQQVGDPETVEAWFRSQGVSTTAPRQFDYQFLASYQLTEFQSRTRVPELLFVQATPLGAVEARVYILNDRQFDLQALSQSRRHAGSGGYNVEVLDGPEGDRLLYLAIYRGESLTPFLRPVPNPI